MSKELEELKKSIANNPTMKKWAKQTAEAQKTIADAINNSKGIHSLDAFYDTPKKTYTPPVDIDEEEWKEINNHYSGKFIGLDVDMEMIESSLDNLYEQWKKGSYPDKVAFFEALDNQFSGYADMLNERKKRDYTSTELFSHYFDEWEKVTYQVKWDGSKVDGLLIDEVIEIETDIEIYLKKRTKHGLEITDRMREFKGLAEFTRERVPELIQQYSLEPQEELPEGCPPVEPVEDLGDNALYIIADDFDQEWEQKKLTEEFRWCKSKRKNFFIWASFKYTYQNGLTFTAKGLQTTLNAARSRAKLDSKKT